MNETQELTCEETPTSISLQDVKSAMLKKNINKELFSEIIKQGLSASKKLEPDHAVRFKYLQLALELLELIPVKKKEDEDFEPYKGSYSELTDGQLEEEYRARLETLRLSPG